MFSTETFKFPIHFLIVIPLVFGLSAYFDSGDGTPTTVHDGAGTGNGDTGSDGSTAPTSFDNMVVLYIRPPATSSSSYLPTYGITLESDTQYLWRYVPDLNQSDLVDQIYSPNYASSNIYPYSVDDRVFVRREWQSFESDGAHDLTELTVNDFAYMDYFSTSDPYYFTDGCSAVVGEAYFYKARRNYDSLYGYLGGDFYRYQNSTDDTMKLLNHGDSNNCFGNLLSDNGELYDVWESHPTSPTNIYLYRRDRRSGILDPAPIIGLLEEFPANFGNYQYSVSNGTFYTARKSTVNGNVEVWKQQFSPLMEPNPVLIFDQYIGPFSSLLFDIDDQQLMLATYEGEVLLMDLTTGSQRQFNMGVNITEIVQVYVAK